MVRSLLKLREQGKIKGIGISVIDARPSEANGSIQAGWVDVVQLIYNILDQRAATECFPQHASIRWGLQSGTCKPGGMARCQSKN